MRIFKAEPKRVASFSPERDRAVLTRTGHAPHRASANQVLGANTPNKHVPIDHFDTRFLETMRAKGWLRDK